MNDKNLIELETQLLSQMAQNQVKARLKFGAIMILVAMFVVSMSLALPMIGESVQSLYGVEK